MQPDEHECLWRAPPDNYVAVIDLEDARSDRED